MFWLKPLNARGETGGDNNDTGVAWLRIAGERASRAQIAEARKTFAIHLDTISLSIVGYHTIDYKLPDGSRMRVVSNNGIHQAMLWPVGTKDTTELPHGFVVVTNWSKTGIFKRRPGPPVTWELDNTPVPQAKLEIVADNQVYRERQENSYFTHPMVLNGTTQRSLWDYLKHAVSNAFTSPSPVVPVCTEVGANYSTKRVRYCVDNTIYQEDGTSVYTMGVSDAILSEEPEAPRFAPANTTANGSRLVLQHFRWAVISPSFGIYRVRCSSEALTQIAEDSYSAEATLATFDGPFGGASQPAGTLATGINEDVRGLEMFVGGFGIIGSTGAYTFLELFTLNEFEWGQTFPEDAFHIDQPVPPIAAEIVPGTLACPGVNTVEYPDLVAELNVGGYQFWRGGTKGRRVASDLFGAGQRWFGRFGSEIERRDCQYEWFANPRTYYALGWADLNLFEGIAGGECIGSFHVDTEYKGMNTSAWGPSGTFFSRTYIVAGENPEPVSIPDPGGGGGGVLNPAFTAWFEANNLKPELLALLAEYPEGFVFGGSNKFAEVVLDIPPRNEAEYTLKSRYVIDFDYKGQFWAAIKVEVQSSGARWTSGAYLGNMVLDTLPTTTVRIYFESNWKGTVDEQLLVEKSTTVRPPFEFPARSKQNPYFYGVPASADKQEMLVRFPPVPGLPLEAIQQLQILAGHQGINPHLACADVRDDVTDEKAISKPGIEFSQHRPTIKPHTRFVSGQLYARTFKISDFPDALWLLAATKCDATMDDAPTGDRWHYMPDLKTTIDNEVFHIEVRDGVIEQWSDEIPPAFFSTGSIGGAGGWPEPEDRVINLHRV